MDNASSSDVIESTVLNSISDYGSEIIIRKEHGDKKEITKVSTNTTMLCHLPQGKEFSIGDLSFIKLESFKNGTTMILYPPHFLYSYGVNRSYPDSYVRSYLHKEILPIIENNIGALYIKPHYTDYTTLKKENGIISDAYSEKSLIFERIGLLSYYDYVKYMELIPEECRFGLLSNRYNSTNDFVFTLRSGAVRMARGYENKLVNAVITVDSSRIVKTRVLLTYSV